MFIKSIIIDGKQTTAERIAPDKVQLNLVAIPLDEQEDAEPCISLRLFVNGKLLQNLESGADGYIRQSVVINDTDSEDITVNFEDVVSKTQSKIKHVLIQSNLEKPMKTESIYENLYQLHQKTISEFKIIDEYFQKLIKPENNHDEQFIRNEFNKVNTLASLKYQLKIAKELEFYDEYKDRIEAKTSYCKNEMTIHETNTLLKEVQVIINEHNSNANNLRTQREQIRREKEVFIISDEERLRVSAQVKQNPWALISIDNKFKSDEEIVRIAIGQHPIWFQYASDALKTNETFVIKCIKEFWYKNIEIYLSVYTRALAGVKEEKRNSLQKELDKLEGEKTIMIKEIDDLKNSLQKKDEGYFDNSGLERVLNVVEKSPNSYGKEFLNNYSKKHNLPVINNIEELRMHKHNSECNIGYKEHDLQFKEREIKQKKEELNGVI